jgi:hypothetical protein
LPESPALSNGRTPLRVHGGANVPFKILSGLFPFPGYAQQSGNGVGVLAFGFVDV